MQNPVPAARKRQKPNATQLSAAEKSPQHSVTRPIGELRPYGKNARRHSDKQIDLIARSIRSFGFINPILVDRDNVIVGGHGRYEAAQRLGLTEVPVVLLDHLGPEEIRAYRIADNRIAELSDWDDEILRLEISDLVTLELGGALDFEVSLTGFSTPEIDLILDPIAVPPKEVERVDLPDKGAAAVSRLGDMWELGPHRLVCGDALDPAVHALLLGDEEVRMVFCDPPYNVPVQGHVRIGGASTHREFAMGVGEMSVAGFRAFLSQSLGAALLQLLPGGVMMVCMDWRHMRELLDAGEDVFTELKNLCVWNKTNGGMGSLYRSKHELICVFRTMGGPSVNNVELGRHGRSRNNVWDYAGVNTFRRGRAADLADHPTVKPTALVADAIRDVSHRGEIVFDLFGGSGSTLLAAEKTGRVARLIELDPLYCDVAIRRWQALTKGTARLVGTGESFAEREVSAAADAAAGAAAGEDTQVGDDTREADHGQA